MRAGVTLIRISVKFDLMKAFLALSFLLGGIEMMLLFSWMGTRFALSCLN